MLREYSGERLQLSSKGQKKEQAFYLHQLLAQGLLRASVAKQ